VKYSEFKRWLLRHGAKEMPEPLRRVILKDLELN
jgi:hypothetical protein